MCKAVKIRYLPFVFLCMVLIGEIYCIVCRRIKAQYFKTCILHVLYVTRKYGRCLVVFSGYKEIASMKDVTHTKRSVTTCTAISIHRFSRTVLILNKDLFLINKENKRCFIYMLVECLEKSGCDIIHAPLIYRSSHCVDYRLLQPLQEMH
ncbi:hypothetical protein CHS0354_019885 [Potamilus streckersoni]|uniref:Uncharacterized protein n=1 Tax=Potamilus streckersoni TaxID=2493646 RepID=A0AAE0SNF0_9BIVA|nr:hypothetical protein CHS0354_019885 [Potamilus streckersoni]